MSINKIKALTFDVFGTVVDYRSTIIHEGKELNQQKGLARGHEIEKIRS